MLSCLSVRNTLIKANAKCWLLTKAGKCSRISSLMQGMITGSSGRGITRAQVDACKSREGGWQGHNPRSGVQPSKRP